MYLVYANYITQYTVPADISANVVSNNNLNGCNFVSGTVTLRCLVTITSSINVPTDVTFNWFGPNGSLTDGNRFIIDSGNINDTTYGSILNISSLTLTDSATEYYCTVTIGASDSFDQTSFIFPATVTSNNISFNVESNK